MLIVGCAVVHSKFPFYKYLNLLVVHIALIRGRCYSRSVYMTVSLKKDKPIVLENVFDIQNKKLK